MGSSIQILDIQLFQYQFRAGLWAQTLLCLLHPSRAGPGHRGSHRGGAVRAGILKRAAGATREKQKHHDRLVRQRLVWEMLGFFGADKLFLWRLTGFCACCWLREAVNHVLMAHMYMRKFGEIRVSGNLKNGQDIWGDHYGHVGTCWDKYGGIMKL